MHNNIIDVDYIDIEKVVFLTAPDVAREIPADEKRVRYWGDVFGDIKECGVRKIDGRKKYTKQTIKAFKIIQKLIDDKQFSHIQVRDYISKNGFEYITDPDSKDLSKDLIGYNGLSSELSVEIEQRLNSFLNSLKTQILENNEILKNDIKEQVAMTVDEVITDILEESMSGIDKELQLQKESNMQLSQQLSDVQQELALTKESNQKQLESQSKQLQTNLENMTNKIIKDIIEDNDKAINEFKCITLEQIKNNQEPKGIIAKIFNLMK